MNKGVREVNEEPLQIIVIRRVGSFEDLGMAVLNGHKGGAREQQ